MACEALWFLAGHFLPVTFYPQLQNDNIALVKIYGIKFKQSTIKCRKVNLCVLYLFFITILCINLNGNSRKTMLYQNTKINCYYHEHKYNHASEISSPDTY